MIRTRMRFLLLGLLLSVGLDAAIAQGPAAANAPIKIGVFVPLTGPFTSYGQPTLDGMQLYFDEIGWTVANRKIEIVAEDDAGNPTQGLNKVKKLVERDKVNILGGCVPTQVLYAVEPYITTSGVPFLISGDCSGIKTTMPGHVAPNIYRITHHSYQDSYALGDWTAKKGYKKIALIASGYSAGHEVVTAFARTFCLAGGQIVQAQWAPPPTLDFAPYLANLPKGKDIDAVVAFVIGGGSARFGVQYSEYGLKNTYPLVDIFTQIVREMNLAQLGEKAEGIVSNNFWTPALDTPANKKFLEAFKRKYGRYPDSYNSAAGYAAARAMADALKAVGGNIEKRKDEFLAALARTKFDAPSGPVSFDAYHQVVYNHYIVETRRVGNEWKNIVIDTYPNVSQFWKWSPDEYSKLPEADPNKVTDCNAVLGKK